MYTIQIDNRKIGDQYPCFIIAEAGVNHNGNLNRAKKMIDVAADAGADAVKFQTYHTEDVVIKSAGKAEYQKRTTGSGETQFSMIKKIELTDDDFFTLSEYAYKREIIFISTPFDKSSVDLLERIGVPAYKISSGEINNYPLLKHIARHHKPVILSTGMATMEEIETALTVLSNGVDEIALLHCITSYPAHIEDLNLRVVQTLRERFNRPVGFSDHSLGIIGSISAVAIGACIIEKHFTLDKKLKGPDHLASLNPKELKLLVQGIRQAEKARGDGIRRLIAEEWEIRKVARRSIVSASKIPAGSVINRTVIALKRPGTGIDPSFIKTLCGKKARIQIPKDTLITWNMIE